MKYFNNIKNFLNNLLKSREILALILILATLAASVIAIVVAKKSPIGVDNPVPSVPASSEVSSSEVSDDSSSSEVSSAISSVTSVDGTTIKEPVYKPVDTKLIGMFEQANLALDVEDNIFMDSLIYTGYNINKHKSDGKMWVYVLAAQKRGLGWLSKISYDYDGGTTGYEVNAQGLPDIAYFEKKDLVCASYATYVYFNYLPNVAGIDTSFLTRPKNPTLAHDWYIAALDWVEKGYSKEIGFKATGYKGSPLKFTPDEPIPIGSVISFYDMRKTNKNWSNHVVFYAGYVNGQHWVYQVGNDNGPEFCTVERMSCGADPMWPISVITPPTTIRMAALADVTVKDNTGVAVSGVSVLAKNKKTGREYKIGTTDALGKASREGLPYGDYTFTYTLPTGYTADNLTQSVTLTSANISANSINFTVKR